MRLSITFRLACQAAPSDHRPMHAHWACSYEGTGRREQAETYLRANSADTAGPPDCLNNLAFIKAEEGQDLDEP